MKDFCQIRIFSFKSLSYFQVTRGGCAVTGLIDTFHKVIVHKSFYTHARMLKRIAYESGLLLKLCFPCSLPLTTLAVMFTCARTHTHQKTMSTIIKMRSIMMQNTQSNFNCTLFLFLFNFYWIPAPNHFHFGSDRWQNDDYTNQQHI